MRTHPRARAAGFTLLEVIIAVGILGVSLISLLSSQTDALRATAYARELTAAAFLAEHKIIDIEWQMRKDGWVDSDVTFEGDFSEEGWPNIEYECLVDFIELPEYTALMDAKSDADAEAGDDGGIAGADDQAFGFVGMVWPQIKGAIESAIRKVTCTVKWKDGNIEHDYDVATFWTHPEAMENTSEFLRNSAMQPGAEDEEGAGEDAGGGGAGGAGVGGAGQGRRGSGAGSGNGRGSGMAQGIGFGQGRTPQ